MATSTRRTFNFNQIIGDEQISERYRMFTVLSSDGETKYHTTANADGVATGCDCPASVNPKVKCYHRTGIESYLRFEAEWNAPIVVETVDEQTAPAEEQTAQPMTIAEYALGSFAQDIEQHVEDDLGEMEREALAIIAEEKRKAFEAVCEQVREIETGLTEEQRETLERWGDVLDYIEKRRKEQAPLQPGNGVEETEFGYIPMRRAG